MSVRYDPDNMAGLCYGCHQYIDSQLEEKRLFFISLLGADKYELLYGRAYQTGKPDEQGWTLYYTQKIKELG